MTTIADCGQLEFTFEELDLEGTLNQVIKEYDIHCISLNSMAAYPKTRKAIVARCNLLLDIQENIYKLIQRGF